MWLNVKFLDDQGEIIDERGAYDFENAILETADTKVYKAEHGIDETVADLTNLPAGPGFHLALNNTIYLDNRIPPMGFTNTTFEEFGSPVVGYSYEDGQYWDDTLYTIPPGAADATVTLYFQTTSREYIEFLRDTNVTNDAGQTAYDAWADPAIGNQSVPVDMDVVALEIGPAVAGDITGDGVVDVNDLLELLGAWGDCDVPNLCPADLTGDNMIDVDDLLALLGNWS
jgi:hypothetical protein